MVLRLIQSASLGTSCSRLLLQITSSLLLGENVTLQPGVVAEMIQKVGGFLSHRQTTRSSW